MIMNHIQLTMINHEKRNLRKYKSELKRLCDHNSNKQIHADIHPGVIYVSWPAPSSKGIIHLFFLLLNQL